VLASQARRIIEKVPKNSIIFLPPVISFLTLSKSIEDFILFIRYNLPACFLVKDSIKFNDLFFCKRDIIIHTCTSNIDICQLNRGRESRRLLVIQS